MSLGINMARMRHSMGMALPCGAEDSRCRPSFRDGAGSGRLRGKVGEELAMRNAQVPAHNFPFLFRKLSFLTRGVGADHAKILDLGQ